MTPQPFGHVVVRWRGRQLGISGRGHFLERAAGRPGERVFRVPIGIWDKTLWGHGLGGEVLDRLLEFGLIEQDADRICAMSVGRANRRSLALFESRGFRIVREVPDEGTVDLEFSRGVYPNRRRDRSA